MKKLISYVCAVAVLFTMTVTAFAADTGSSQRILTAFQGSFQIGNVVYSLPDSSIQEIRGFLSSHAADSEQADIIVKDISDSIAEVKTAIADHSNAVNLMSLPGATKAAIHLRLTDSKLCGKGKLYASVRFDPDNRCVYLDSTKFSVPTLQSTIVGGGGSSGGGHSGNVTVPTDNSVNTVTNATGGTTVTVATQADSTPAVTGNVSSFSVTVPADAANLAASATDAQHPVQVEVSAPSATLIGELSGNTVTAVQMTVNVPASLANNTNPNVDVSLNLDSSVLAAAKQQQKDITVHVEDSSTQSILYSWTFHGSDLAASGEALKTVNLALSVQSVTADAAVGKSVPAADKGVILRFGSNGELPAPATVKVYVGNMGYQSGQTAYVYYYNSDIGQLETVRQAVCQVDANGYVSLVIDHCSEYVLLPQQVQAAAPIRLDTGKRLSVEVGKTYQFKITASQKPSFTCGNNSVFKVTYSGSRGSDYFFKVTAVGNPGQGAGFYVNQEKVPRTIGTVGPASVKLDTDHYLWVKSGKSYQAKITSSKQPVFFCGTKSVFQVTSNGSKGNDYFFKITATGKPGECAGLYVNNERVPRVIAIVTD